MTRAIYAVDSRLFHQHDLTQQGREDAWAAISDIDPGDVHWQADLAAIAMVLVDAVLVADAKALELLGDPLRDKLAALRGCGQNELEMCGWLNALLSIARWTLQRLPSPEELKLKGNTQACAFFKALEHSPRTSADLRFELRTGDSQVSRVGHQLLSLGIVVRRFSGKEAVWELTPRGRHLAATVQVVPVPPPSQRQHRRPVARCRPSRQLAGAYLAAASVDSPEELVGDDPQELLAVQPCEGGGWSVGADAAGKPAATFSSKREATEAAKRLVASAGGGRVALHYRSGQLQRVIEVRPQRS